MRDTMTGKTKYLTLIALVAVTLVGCGAWQRYGASNWIVDGGIQTLYLTKVSDGVYEQETVRILSEKDCAIESGTVRIQLTPHSGAGSVMSGDGGMCRVLGTQIK